MKNLNKKELSSVTGAQKLLQFLEYRQLSNIIPVVFPTGIQCKLDDSSGACVTACTYCGPYYCGDRK